jgi:hypothetical protein
VYGQVAETLKVQDITKAKKKRGSKIKGKIETDTGFIYDLYFGRAILQAMV